MAQAPEPEINDSTRALSVAAGVDCCRESAREAARQLRRLVSDAFAQISDITNSQIQEAFAPGPKLPITITVPRILEPIVTPGFRGTISFRGQEITGPSADVRTWVQEATLRELDKILRTSREVDCEKCIRSSRFGQSRKRETLTRTIRARV